MSTPDDRLSGLVERLEKATKGSREFDAEIFRVAFDADVWAYHENCHIDAQIQSGNWQKSREEHPDFDAEGDAILTWRYRIGDGPVAKYGELPRLTESIDAAMTLLYPGLYWMMAKGRLKPSEPLYAAQIIDAESGIAVTEAEHNSLEICICIAALKAKSRSRTALSASKVQR